MVTIISLLSGGWNERYGSGRSPWELRTIAMDFHNVYKYTHTHTVLTLTHTHKHVVYISTLRYSQI